MPVFIYIYMGSPVSHSWYFHNGYAQPLNPKSFERTQEAQKSQKGKIWKLLHPTSLHHSMPMGASWLSLAAALCSSLASKLNKTSRKSKKQKNKVWETTPSHLSPPLHHSMPKFVCVVFSMCLVLFAEILGFLSSVAITYQHYLLSSICCWYAIYKHNGQLVDLRAFCPPGRPVCVYK